MKKLIINADECIGCDLCVELCPDLFLSAEFVPEPVNVDVTDNTCAYDSVSFCPTDAISIE